MKEVMLEASGQYRRYAQGVRLTAGKGVGVAVEVGVTLGVTVAVGVSVGVGVAEANNPFRASGLKLQLNRMRTENANNRNRMVFERVIFIPRDRDQW